MQQITVKAEINEQPKILDLVGDFLLEKHVDLKIVTSLNVVIDEIFSNIVNYAYPKERGDVEICFDINDENILELTFSDSGIKFNPLLVENPDINSPLDDRKVGGLGIFLVKKIMDSVTYDYINNKNVLKMTKKL